MDQNSFIRLFLEKKCKTQTNMRRINHVVGRVAGGTTQDGQAYTSSLHVITNNL
jgi:hypothetical protein